MNKPPIVHFTQLASGSYFLRFNSLEDIYYYDVEENNPRGISIRRRDSNLEDYKQNRNILTPKKLKLIENVQKELTMDPEFLQLIYKGKSIKRKQDLNKFVGNLSIVQYAKGAEKLFHRMIPGAKKQTLNLAFQVGTFIHGDYNHAFTKILKTIMMCQAMNISVNIDMFDSDTKAINERAGYVIVNICKSNEKINFKNILATSHSAFFNHTLFNGYSASGMQKYIGTFLGSDRIVKDLGPFYDVIGGNLLSSSESGKNEMISKVLKIGKII